MADSPRIHFTIYGRAWCHLCDDMLASLRDTEGAGSWNIAWVDIDVEGAVDEALARHYDERVPVLTGALQTGVAISAATEICHYFLDRHALGEFLARVHDCPISA